MAEPWCMCCRLEPTSHLSSFGGKIWWYNKVAIATAMLFKVCKKHGLLGENCVVVIKPNGKNTFKF